MPLTRFEECWPLPTESLSELHSKPQHSNPNPNPLAFGVLTSLLLPHLSSSLTDSLPFLNLLCHSKTDAQFMQDSRKAVWSISHVSVALFPSLKQNFIAYRSSKVSDCTFEIHQLWQSGFSRVYSNCCCSCLFELKIIKIGQSSHKMYSNNVVNFQESTTKLNASTKKGGNLLKAPHLSFEAFLYNSYIVIWFQVFLFNVNNFSLFRSFKQLFLFNNLFIIILMSCSILGSHTKDLKNGTWCRLS